MPQRNFYKAYLTEILKSILFFFIGRTTTAPAVARRTITATAFMFKLSVNEISYYSRNSNAYDYYHCYIYRIHLFLPSFLFLLNIFVISKIPRFFKTTSTVTEAIAISHINKVHHQLPKV